MFFRPYVCFTTVFYAVLEHLLFTVQLKRITGWMKVVTLSWYLLQFVLIKLYHCSGFPHLLESPGIFIGKFPGLGKSWKMTLVLESPGSLLARSWKVLEFARQWCTWQFLFSNRHVSADENSHNCCHQVRCLGCRYAKNAFTSRVPPQTLLAELTALSQTP